MESRQPEPSKPAAKGRRPLFSGAAFRLLGSPAFFDGVSPVAAEMAVSLLAPVISQVLGLPVEAEVAPARDAQQEADAFTLYLASAEGNQLVAITLGAEAVRSAVAPTFRRLGLATPAGRLSEPERAALDLAVLQVMERAAEVFGSAPALRLCVAHSPESLARTSTVHLRVRLGHASRVVRIGTSGAFNANTLLAAPLADERGAAGLELYVGLPPLAAESVRTLEAGAAIALGVASVQEADRAELLTGTGWRMGTIKVDFVARDTVGLSISDGTLAPAKGFDARDAATLRPAIPVRPLLSWQLASVLPMESMLLRPQWSDAVLWRGGAIAARGTIQTIDGSLRFVVEHVSPTPR